MENTSTKPKKNSQLTAKELMDSLKKIDPIKFGTQKTEFYCHGCSGFIAVELNMDLNGNHEVHCPKCDHIHYRVIKDGVVTEERYASSGSIWAGNWVNSNGPIISYRTTMDNWSNTNVTSTATGVSGNSYLAMAWVDHSGTGSGIVYASTS